MGNKFIDQHQLITSGPYCLKSWDSQDGLPGFQSESVSEILTFSLIGMLVCCRFTHLQPSELEQGEIKCFTKEYITPPDPRIETMIARL